MLHEGNAYDDVRMTMMIVYEELIYPSGPTGRVIHTGTGEGATPQKKTAPLPEAPLLTALEPLLSPLSFPELILGEKIGGGSTWGRKCV